MEPKTPHYYYDLLHVSVMQTDFFVKQRLEESNDPRFLKQTNYYKSKI